MDIKPILGCTIRFEQDVARDIIVIGNWKMHKTAHQAAEMIELLAPSVAGCQARPLLAVPFTAISAAVAAAKQTKIVIGAQNMHDAQEGPFTGEISALMLKEAGATFVLLGHSERRRLFGETDSVIHRKIVRALQDDLQPVLCIGETLREREEGRTEEVLSLQLEHVFTHVPKTAFSSVRIAYEPVWAIGTGKSATPQMVQKVHAFCRSCVKKIYDSTTAQAVAILYGGSVKAERVRELVSQDDVDGVLVGGASLEPASFAAIIQQCEGVR
jgi:triosephosphate isomerase (TIM)